MHTSWRLVGLLLLLLPAAARGQGCLGLPTIPTIIGVFTQSTTTDGGNRGGTSALSVALSRAVMVGARYTRESYAASPGLPPNASGPGATLTAEWMSRRSASVSLCPTIALTALNSGTVQLGPDDAVRWSATRFAPGFAVGVRRELSDDIVVVPFATTAVVLESFSGNQAAGQPDARAYGVAEVGLSVLLWKAIAIRWSTGQAMGSGGSYPLPIVRSTLAASVAWTR
jgi:hypothetical protein